jgi:hypothetical protein
MEQLGWLCIGFVVVLSALTFFAAKRHAKTLHEKAKADKELMRSNPEAWRAQQLVQLDRERLESQRRLAEGRAKQESLVQNVGIIWRIGRGLGWW